MVAASDFLTGTRPCIFSWQPADSYQVAAWWDSPIYLQVRCSGSFPVLASGSSGDRTREIFAGPSPPPHGDPGAVATFSSLSSNLPGAGPRPNSAGRTSPRDRDAAARARRLYEELSHQGHSKRWHCRPRRHREDATGVVVA